MSTQPGSQTTRPTLLYFLLYLLQGHVQEPEVVRDYIGAVLGEEVHPLPRPDLPVAVGSNGLVIVVLVALLALAKGLAEVLVEGRVALQVLREGKHGMFSNDWICGQYSELP